MDLNAFLADEGQSRSLPLATEPADASYRIEADTMGGVNSDGRILGGRDGLPSHGSCVFSPLLPLLTRTDPPPSPQPLATPTRPED